MSEAACVENEAGTEQRCESPPPAAMPAREEPDPRAKLHQLAAELAKSHNRRLIVEYLRLRRAIR
jgi:hypothetical protein